jgi:hypothetical protein
MRVHCLFVALLLLSACRSATTCVCEIAVQDKARLASLLSKDWETLDSATTAKLWSAPLALVEGSPTACSETVVMNSIQPCRGCSNTFLFEQRREGAGCVQQLASVTLLRQLPRHTAPAGLEEELRSIAPGTTSDSLAMGPQGFIRVLDRGQSRTHTIRAEIEPKNRGSLVRLLIYQTVFEQ